MEKVEKLILKNRLKVARAEKNYSQGVLAELVGVSRQTISSIEKGHFSPTAKLAYMFCIALDKKFEDLFYFEIEEVVTVEETVSSDDREIEIEEVRIEY